MPSSNNSTITITIGARPSPLSRAQVREILEALQLVHPQVEFAVHYLPTIGDKDQISSLRTMERTNFFTQEIDDWVLEGEGRVGIHSAKDLPSPLAPGLSIFCITKGIDPSDVLVLRSSDTLESLPPGSRIATSSLRREERVKQMRSDLSFCDLRGTIEQRLSTLYNGETDGVVVAEAALIRLGLTHLNRVVLPGHSAPGQGQLSVVGRTEERDLRHLFSCLNHPL